MTRTGRLTLLASCSLVYLAVATRLGDGLGRRQFANGAYADFFDIQARALLDGHLAIPRGAIGIEAFVVDGRDYMYFGLFPSLARLPIVAATDALKGDLTVVSSFLAWLTFVLCAWALADEALPRLVPEAGRSAARAVDVIWKVAIALGSPMLMLAGPAWVFSEAIMWGVAASVFFQLRLVRELWASSPRNQLWLGAALLLATLNRPTHGLGCLAVTAALVVVRSARRRRVGADEWRLGAAAAVGTLALTVPNILRFRRPFGLPMEAQVISHFEDYRVRMLAYAGSDYTDVRYLPSNVVAYLRPDGIGLGTRFPFITSPHDVPVVFGGAIHDITNRTPSIVATTPLLVALAVAGVVVGLAGWRRPGPHRSLLLASAAGIPAVGAHLVWGFITPRFLADFLPLMVPVGIVGAATLAGRIGAMAPRPRRWSLVGAGALAVWSVAANVGVAVESSYLTGYDGDVRELLALQGRDDVWTAADAVRWDDVADFVIDPRDPPRAGTIAILGDCEAAYLSNGEPVDPWLVLDYGPNDFRRVFAVDVADDLASSAVWLATFTNAGEPIADRPNIFSVSLVADAERGVRLELADEFGTLDYPIDVAPGDRFQLAITSDPVRRVLSFDVDGRTLAYGHHLTRSLYGPEGQSAEFAGATADEALTVAVVDVADPC